MSIKSSIKTALTLGKGMATGLPEAAADGSPIELFQAWSEAAEESGLFLPEAVSLATATPDGVPSVRMVLLKGVDERGFVFYTNYASRKASELEANPRAAMCCHWPILERQVRVSGPVVRLEREESAAYFATRPRGSRLGAWASRQSETLGARAELEARLEEVRARFGDGPIPVPDFWGGYRIEPTEIEFWQGRTDRLHDRLVFTRTADGWSAKRLYP